MKEEHSVKSVCDHELVYLIFSILVFFVNHCRLWIKLCKLSYQITNRIYKLNRLKCKGKKSKDFCIR
jgi:hypothetical protein